MAGCIDIYESRRTHFEHVRYWKRDDDSIPTSELVHEPVSGQFYARELNAESVSREIVDDSFMFDDHTSMLVTYDNVSDLAQNDICEYDGKTWMVYNIQRKKRHKRSEFSKNNTFVYYISLRS